MGRWTVAVVAAGVLWGTGARGFQPFVSEEDPELVELRERLAAHADSLARIEEEQALHEEAVALGVVAAVEATKLPPRQQRRLAVKIVREAKRNELDPMLILAVIRCESAFNNYAVSHVGAMGLMQVMPDTGVYLAGKAGFRLGRHSNLFDSELNVELGTSYLADLIQRFGTVEEALVAYNAGPGLAKRILARPGTRARFMAGYPAKVMHEFRRLKAWQARELTRAEEKSASDGPG